MGFDVIVQGKVKNGLDPLVVRGRLATLMKIPDDRAARLLAGQHSRVLKNVDRARAEKYRDALLGIGVEVIIKVNADAEARDPVPPSPPSAQIGAGSTVKARDAGAPASAAPAAPMAQTDRVRKTPKITSPARSIPGNNHRGWMIPIAFCSLAAVIVAGISFLATRPHNPPRYKILEPANSMARDILRLHDVISSSANYKKAAIKKNDQGRPDANRKEMLVTAFEDSIAIVNGESLTHQIQAAIDNSRIAPGIEESRSKIRQQINELHANPDDFGEDYQAACTSLKAFHSSYEKLIETGLHPSQEGSLIDFAAAYDIQRMLFNAEFIGVIETISQLEESEPGDEPLFASQRDRALEFSAKLNSTL